MGVVGLGDEDLGRGEAQEEVADPSHNFSFVVAQRAVSKAKFESTLLGHVKSVKSTVPLTVPDLDDAVGGRPGCGGVPAATSVGGQSHGGGVPTSCHLGQEEAASDGLIVGVRGKHQGRA